MKKDKLSRRRFLTLTGGMAAAIVCAGCLGTAEASENTAAVAPKDTVEVSESPVEVAKDTTAVAESPTQAPRNTACPRGLVNDPYPGRCRLYRDTNGNGYCDLSEPEV